MPVNNFEFEKADGIISSIKGQSVGRDPISAAGIFDFVSIAQKGFGYEPEEEIDMLLLLYLDINNDPVITGDFAKALQDCKDLKPFVVLSTQVEFNTSGRMIVGQPFTFMDVDYDPVNDPDTIALYLSSSSGYNWTSEGLEYFSA